MKVCSYELRSAKCFEKAKAERSYECPVGWESRSAPSSTPTVLAVAVGGALVVVAAAIHVDAEALEWETTVEQATAELAVPSTY